MLRQRSRRASRKDECLLDEEVEEAGGERVERGEAGGEVDGEEDTEEDTEEEGLATLLNSSEKGMTRGGDSGG